MTATNNKMYLVVTDPTQVLIPTSGCPVINETLPPMKKEVTTEDGVDVVTWVEDWESPYVSLLDRLKGLRYSARRIGGRVTGHPESEVDKRASDLWRYIGDDPLLVGRTVCLFDIVPTKFTLLAEELKQLVQAQSAAIEREIAYPEGALIWPYEIPEYFERVTSEQ